MAGLWGPDAAWARGDRTVAGFWWAGGSGSGRGDRTVAGLLSPTAPACRGDRTVAGLLSPTAPARRRIRTVAGLLVARDAGGWAAGIGPWLGSGG